MLGEVFSFKKLDVKIEYVVIYKIFPRPILRMRCVDLIEFN